MKVSGYISAFFDSIGHMRKLSGNELPRAPKTKMGEVEGAVI
jgi:hypothetical protein